MLKAYFDESGLHGEAKVFVMAGYVAPEREWETGFASKWKHMLQKPLIDPPLSCFHAVDVEGRGHGRFRLITQEEREVLKQDAVNAVVGSGIIGVASAVIIEDFNKIITGKIRDLVGDPYLLCFQHVIMEAGRRGRAFLEEDLSEDIAFIFDQHPRWSVLALEMYGKMLAQPGAKEKWRLGSAEFSDKMRFAPLQAADHIAYETYQYMLDRRLSNRRPAMNRFFSWNQHHGRYFDEAGCLSFVEELKKAGKI